MLRPALTAVSFFALVLMAPGAEGDRAPPTRPGAVRSAPKEIAPPPPTKARPPSPTANHPLGKVNVDLLDAVERFGIKAAVTSAGRKVLLTAGRNRVELEINSREIEANGLRVFLGAPLMLRRGEYYVSRVDFDGCLLPLLQPARVVTKPPAVRVIAIDPGHGGRDNGMINTALGLKEKELALDVAKRLQDRLEQAGFKVVLTRSGDRPLSDTKRTDLLARAAAANRAGADLFVSIHFNSLFPDTKTGGTEMYIYTRPGQRSDTSHGYGEEDDSRTDPQEVNRYDAWSALLAHKLHRSLLDELKTDDRGLKTKHLLVLQDVKCPAALVESVFLSNPTEAKRAATPAYRQKIADALADGIRDYVAVVDAVR